MAGGQHFDGEGNDIRLFHHLGNSHKALKELEWENQTQPHAIQSDSVIKATTQKGTCINVKS
jgi:hypothetical protein